MKYQTAGAIYCRSMDPLELALFLDSAERIDPDLTVHVKAVAHLIPPGAVTAMRRRKRRQQRGAT